MKLLGIRVAKLLGIREFKMKARLAGTAGGGSLLAIIRAFFIELRFNQGSTTEKKRKKAATSKVSRLLTMGLFSWALLLVPTLAYSCLLSPLTFVLIFYCLVRLTNQPVGCWLIVASVVFFGGRWGWPICLLLLDYGCCLSHLIAAFG
jgi:hypothetical protein